MQEAKAVLTCRIKRRPIAARCFQQMAGAQHVGLNERARIGDGPVDMGFGGEIDHGTGTMRSQQFPHGCLIGDIAVDETMARVAGHGRQVIQITGVGQFVQRDDGFVAVR
ncbi:hypothetical protein D3C72_2267020 [compost metagenome]